MKEKKHEGSNVASGSGYHVPVLFHESLEALNIKPNGVYVDCTFGGGGHSRGILEKLGANGTLIAFDQDADAQRNLPDDKRVVFVPQNFRHLQRFLRLHKFPKVDGVLADLGVSSHQFDEGERGFSIRFEGPLDMRMDRRTELTAEKVLLTYTELQLHKLFEQYGEVTNSKTLAKHIVQNRKQSSLKTINDFRAMLHPVVKGNPNKYLAQVFQALRIEVNDEMGALKEMLQQLPQVLNPGARAAIITFHSIEDRLVKNFFKQGGFDEVIENPFVQEEKEVLLKVISKKPIVATEEETKRNPRSRSAKLRIAERI
ncbi:16S rRNA (cytosine(1402)-N(4))-methyltransferase RsmH [Panacibacter ginsenosidivorans]|uniref:Ribosomal RNA small subunit methyltransferase H n=1 Tax=Panacibacter ginsenosidivorans TaxID=1813871 RepID=A0A5B8VDV1_9BACT|nr:16S rRNA (cytosine(1402)-N(4))-methyltransferase RsmH [Panacibacter ginsenosidivorans]QEC68826.1 16S rRNA (cytosine(1402)-N(4))-methyltransferase RsmH [Panacibacter ginsenosidivorans]